MSVDIEDIESTKSEKLLAIVLTTFLLMGSVWIYVKADAWLPGGPTFTQSTAELKAMRVQEKAWDAQAAVEAEVERERSELGLAKNAFDIAAAKGDSVAAADAEADYAKAELEFRDAEGRLLKAQQRTRAAEEGVRTFERARQGMDHEGHDWAVAGFRLAFIVGWILAALRITNRLRQRSSRFLPLGFAAVGTGVITAVVFATDYITEFVDPLELGPIVLSGIGTLATMGAFVGLQEWLERRLPGKRVRNSECPYCAHPVRAMADGSPAPFCEGCGHAVTEPCAACGSPRRVGAAHCPACGDGGPDAP